MDIREALETVQTLASGVDPETGEAFGEASPYRRESVTRALLLCVEQIRNPPCKTPEQRRAENLEHGRPRNAGLPWTEAMRDELALAFHDGATLGELARISQRSRGAVLSELKRQGLVKDYWNSRPSHADPAAS